MEESIKKADTLIEALPYIRSFRHKVVVIKYGGSILREEKIRQRVIEDIIFLNLVGIRPVLVHGGGPMISERMRKMGKKVEFIAGLRVTDSESLLVAIEELVHINTDLVSQINSLGGRASALGNPKNCAIRVRKRLSRKDLGFVGQVIGIDKKKIINKLNKGFVPVISPLGLDSKGRIYNVNADEAAEAIASGLGAEKLVLLTDVKGIMRDHQDIGSLISTLNIAQAKSLIKNKVIFQGMVPKVVACMRALEAGVKKTHIIDARLPHAILLEIFTDGGIGTEIVRAES
jgi:acetylglutamate kinase